MLREGAEMLRDGVALLRDGIELLPNERLGADEPLLPLKLPLPLREGIVRFICSLLREGAEPLPKERLPRAPSKPGRRLLLSILLSLCPPVTRVELLRWLRKSPRSQRSCMPKWFWRGARKTSRWP